VNHDPIWGTVHAALWLAAFLLIFAYAVAGLWAT